MRQILLVLFLGLPVLGFGQAAADWSILPGMGQTYLYRTDSVSASYRTSFSACTPPSFTLPRAGYWEQLRIDSLLTVGAWKLYRTNRCFQYYSGLWNNSRHGESTPGMLGDSILEEPGTGVFHLQDSTVFFSKAGLGDRLLRRGRDSGSWENLQIIWVGVAPLNGVSDSIKVAEGGYVLSRRHGLVQIPALDNLPFTVGARLRRQAGYAGTPRQLPAMEADSVLSVMPGDEVHIVREAQPDATTDLSFGEWIRRKYLAVDLSRSDTAVYLVEDSLIHMERSYALNCHGRMLVRVDTTVLKVAKSDFSYVAHLPFDSGSARYSWSSGTVREDSLGVYFFITLSSESDSWGQVYRHAPFRFGCGGLHGAFDCEKPVYILHGGIGKGTPLHLRPLFTANRPRILTEVLLEPNPARGYVHVQTDGGEAVSLALWSIEGRQLRVSASSRPGNFDIGQVPPGYYLAEIFLVDGRRVHRRLVVER